MFFVVTSKIHCEIHGVGLMVLDKTTNYFILFISTRLWRQDVSESQLTGVILSWVSSQLCLAHSYIYIFNLSFFIFFFSCRLFISSWDNGEFEYSLECSVKYIIHCQPSDDSLVMNSRLYTACLLFLLLFFIILNIKEVKKK